MSDHDANVVPITHPSRPPPIRDGSPGVSPHMQPISPAPRRRIAAGLALTCAISASMLVGQSPTASAASVAISRVNAGGLTGHVGVDVPGGNGQYASHHYWDENDAIAPIEVGNPQEWARFEFFPNMRH